MPSTSGAADASWQSTSRLRAGYELYSALNVWVPLQDSQVTATAAAAQLQAAWQALPRTEKLAFANLASSDAAYQNTIHEASTYTQHNERVLRLHELRHLSAQCETPADHADAFWSELRQQLARAADSPNGIHHSKDGKSGADSSEAADPAETVAASAGSDDADDEEEDEEEEEEEWSHPYADLRLCMEHDATAKRGVVNVDWPGYWEYVYKYFFSPPAPDGNETSPSQPATGLKGNDTATDGPARVHDVFAKLSAVRDALTKTPTVVSTIKSVQPSLLKLSSAARERRIRELRQQLKLQRCRNRQMEAVVAARLREETADSKGVMLPPVRARKKRLFTLYRENLKWATIVGTLCRGLRDRSCAAFEQAAPAASKFLPPSWRVSAPGRPNPNDLKAKQKSEHETDETDDVTCAVCFNGDSLDDNQIVLCDRCDPGLHAERRRAP